MTQTVIKPGTLRGSITLPGDKSISHRSLILNSIAVGRSEVIGLSSGDDVMSTLKCLRALGVGIEPKEEQGTYTIEGRGSNLREPSGALDSGNSGTTMRLLSGVLASQTFASTLKGDNSLSSRPMARVIQPLKLMGAAIKGARSDSLPPLKIWGRPLKGIEYTMNVASAQVKSAVILAALSAEGDTVIHQPALSRDHTERLVDAMGGHVEVDGLTLIVHPSALSATPTRIPGDMSAAAFWVVAALCHPDARVMLRGVGLNPSRTGILDVVQAMGAEITLEGVRDEGGEPVADISVTSSDLSAVEIGGDIISNIIDEIPILALAACFANGTTVIRDASELRFKESDRLHATVTELSHLGAKLEETPDGMVVHGTGKLVGGLCSSHGDHRLAMTLAVAGLLSEKSVTIKKAGSVRISYPEFWEHLLELSNGGVS